MQKIFPVSRSTLSSDALLSEILTHYDIGNLVECKFWNIGLNDTYQVDTNQGKYILRVYRAGWRTRSDILYELEVLQHLMQQGISVSVAVPRKDGELLQEILAPEGPRMVVLFTYAPGIPPTYETNVENESYLYGKNVALIHTATDQFSSQHPRFHLDLNHLIHAPLKSLLPHLRTRPVDCEYLVALVTRLQQLLTDLPLKYLEMGFCHGDFHGWNVNIDPGSVLTFYDFDCCGYGWRAYDLAVFRWCARYYDKEAERWPAYLRGYLDVRPLNEIEIKAIPYFVAIRQIWFLGLHTDNGQDWGFGEMDDPFWDHAFKFFRDWEAEFLSE